MRKSQVPPANRALHAGNDTGDENVAVLLCVTKKVQMPDVKQVEGTNGVADARPHDLPRSVIPQ